MPSPATPGSTNIATATAPGVTPVANGGGNAATDFLFLLAGMITPTPPAATTATPSQANPNMALNLAELPELAALEDSSPDDDTDTSDEELSSEEAMALSVLPLPALSFPAIAPLPVGEATTFSPADTERDLTDPATTYAAAIPNVEADIADVTANMAAPPAANTAVDPTATADDNASTSSTSTPTSSQLHALSAARALQDIDPAAPREIRAPLGTPAWTQEVGDQLTWMAQNGREAASLRLSPEHLGPLEIRISMREGEASVWFGATHADTRSALEQSLPRLRELFATQGMVLADAGVFKEAPREQPRSAAPDNARHSRDEGQDADALPRTAIKHIRLIDTYV